MVLRWFKNNADLRILAATRVSIATAYRYLHEGINVIADRAPDEVLGRALRELGLRVPGATPDAAPTPVAAKNPDAATACGAPGRNTSTTAATSGSCAAGAGYPEWGATS